MSELTLPTATEEPAAPQARFSDLCREIRQDVRNNFGWSRPGARAMIVYRVGRWLLDRRPSLLRKVLLRLQRSMERYVRNAYGIEIYRTARIGRGFVIAHQSGIVLHEYATIGDDCIVRQGVTMGVATSRVGDDFASTGPVLGDRVDVGAGAVIMGAVRIGSDVRIFPNALVMTNVASHTTVMSAPSRLITMQPSGSEPKDPK